MSLIHFIVFASTHFYFPSILYWGSFLVWLSSPRSLYLSLFLSHCLSFSRSSKFAVNFLVYLCVFSFLSLRCAWYAVCLSSRVSVKIYRIFVTICRVFVRFSFCLRIILLPLLHLRSFPLSPRFLSLWLPLSPFLTASLSEVCHGYWKQSRVFLRFFPLSPLLTSSSPVSLSLTAFPADLPRLLVQPRVCLCPQGYF